MTSPNLNETGHRDSPQIPGQTVRQPMTAVGRVKKNGLVVFITICSLFFLASVATTTYFTGSMSGGMDMPGGWNMSMMWMPMPGQAWAASGGLFLLMWESMMIAMMLPSAAPMLLRHCRAHNRESPLSASLSMTQVAGGYFFIWLVIGILVFAVGMIMGQLTMKLPGLSRAIPLLSGLALVLAGVVQLTPWKMRGLRQCRIMTTSLKNQSKWHIGLKEGLSCAICCSGPMLILLVTGIMNLLMMVIVTVIIAVEKLIPKPNLFVKFSGFVIIALGVFIAVRSLF